jgi:mono/diheme cytochrome c family protein
MKKALKWIGIGLVVIVVLLLVAVFGLYMLGRSRIQGPYQVDVQMVDIPTDEAALARGEHIVTAISGCAECHTANLGGQIFIDAAPIGQVVASNLTSGAGGVGSRYSDEDFVRVIRHGIKPDGTTVMPMMPSSQLSYMSDEDLGAVIAYIRSVPPVDQELPPTELDFTGNIILGVLGADSLPARWIDQTATRPAQMELAVTPEYGEYLSRIGGCRDCHGENLAGGRVDPESPFAPNLTRGGNLASWREEDFITLIRTGMSPERPISPAMPWQIYQNMTDEELQALWAYLQTLPQLPTNPE